MEHILVLIDFTPTALISLNQANAIAKEHGARITLCHIAKSYYKEIPKELEDQMIPFTTNLEKSGIEHKVLFGRGELIGAVKSIVEDLVPDLMIVGTHGKVGIKQNLFGSTIFKLIKHVPSPALIVNDKCPISERGFHHVLLPVAPHDTFHLKVKETAKLVSDEGKISIFAIIKPGGDLDEKILKNIAEAKRLLDHLSVKWEYVEIESEHYSLGYSKLTLDYAKENQMDLVSILVDVSEENQHFGAIDKENLLINNIGIPVLCTNS